MIRYKLSYDVCDEDGDSIKNYYLFFDEHEEYLDDFFDWFFNILTSSLLNNEYGQSIISLINLKKTKFQKVKYLPSVLFLIKNNNNISFNLITWWYHIIHNIRYKQKGFIHAFVLNCYFLFPMLYY